MRHQPNQFNEKENRLIFREPEGPPSTRVEKEKPTEGSKTADDLSKLKATIQERKVEAAADNDFQKWEKLTEVLEEQGAYVQWNHPAKGPTKPKLLLTNNHIPVGATENERRRADAMYGDYRALKFLASMGKNVFAIEGKSFGKPVFPGHFIYTPLPENRYRLRFLGPKIDWQKTTVEPGTYRMTPEQVRIFFGSDRMAREFLSGLQGSMYGPVGEIFIAGYINDPNVHFVGAEPPGKESGVEQRLEQEKKYLQTFTRFQKAIAEPGARDENGGIGFGYKYDDETGKLTQIDLAPPDKGWSILEAQFTLQELEESILWSLGELSSQRKLDAERETFISNELNADIVLIGSGHMGDFLRMKNNTRSLGIVIPKETKEYAPMILEDPFRSSVQGRFLSSVKQIQTETIDKIRKKGE